MPELAARLAEQPSCCPRVSSRLCPSPHSELGPSSATTVYFRLRDRPVSRLARIVLHLRRWMLNQSRAHSQSPLPLAHQLHGLLRPKPIILIAKCVLGYTLPRVTPPDVLSGESGGSYGTFSYVIRLINVHLTSHNLSFRNTRRYRHGGRLFAAVLVVSSVS